MVAWDRGDALVPIVLYPEIEFFTLPLLKPSGFTSTMDHSRRSASLSHEYARHRGMRHWCPLPLASQPLLHDSSRHCGASDEPSILDPSFSTGLPGAGRHCSRGARTRL